MPLKSDVIPLTNTINRGTVGNFLVMRKINIFRQSFAIFKGF